MSPDLPTITSKSVDNHPLLPQLEAAYFELQPSNQTHVTALLNEAQSLTGDTAKAFVLAALSWCQRLYNAGRSAEAVPLARVCTALADELTDAPLQHRAATAYGNVLGDCGAITQAIRQHARALKLAEASGNLQGVASSWNNIGGTFCNAGVYLLAHEAYQRTLQAARQAADLQMAYKSYGNLAFCHLHLRDTAAGLKAVQQARICESTSTQNPLDAIILQSTSIRLLLRAGEIKAAHQHLHQLQAQSLALPSPRATIATLLAQGGVDIALGQTDLGLTALRRALALARQHTPALADALIALADGEERAGNLDLAALYLSQLADRVHAESVQEARRHIEISILFDHIETEAVQDVAAACARLQASPHSRGAPVGNFEALAVAAAFKLDASGYHAAQMICPAAME